MSKLEACMASARKVIDDLPAVEINKLDLKLANIEPEALRQILGMQMEAVASGQMTKEDAQWVNSRLGENPTLESWVALPLIERICLQNLLADLWAANPSWNKGLH